MGKRMVVAGVNSGTSADGIDVCIAAWTFGDAASSDEVRTAIGLCSMVDVDAQAMLHCTHHPLKRESALVL